MGNAGLPVGRSSRQPASACKAAFGSSREVLQWERAASAQRSHRPEAEPSMDPAVSQPCPDIPGLQGYYPRKGQAAGSMSDMPRHLPRVSPARAFPQGLGRIEAYLEGRCGQDISPHCQSLDEQGFWQREGGSKWADPQALARPAASAQQGEKEAHCAPRSALPLEKQAVLLGEPRSCLIGSG